MLWTYENHESGVSRHQRQTSRHGKRPDGIKICVTDWSRANWTFNSNRKAALQFVHCKLLGVTKSSESNKKLPDNYFHLLFSVKKCWSRLKIFSEDISYGFDQEETGFYLICHVSSKGNVYLHYIYPWKPYLVWLRQYFKLCSGVWDNIIHKLHWPLPFKLLVLVSHAPLTLSIKHSITFAPWENISPYAHNVGQNESLGRLPFARTDGPKRTGSHLCKWKVQGRSVRLLTRSLRGILERVIKCKQHGRFSYETF